MRNSMRQLLILITFIFLAGFQKQSFRERQVNIKDIAWTFEVPEPLRITDSSFNKAGVIKPEKWTERGEDVSFTLFSINNGTNGSITTFLWKDTLNAKQWEEFYRKDATWYFQSASQHPTKKLLDSAYTNEVVNNRNYKRQYLKYYDDKRKDTIYLYHYFTRCKAKQKKIKLTLDIGFAFTDSSFGHKYLELVNSSNFSD
jgi:hypothetical protein